MPNEDGAWMAHDGSRAGAAPARGSGQGTRCWVLLTLVVLGTAALAAGTTALAQERPGRTGMDRPPAREPASPSNLAEFLKPL